MWTDTLPTEWEERKLWAIADFVNRGSTPNYVDASAYGVVNQATFSKGFFDTSKLRFTHVRDARQVRGVLQPFDILLASTGGLRDAHIYCGFHTFAGVICRTR